MTQAEQLARIAKLEAEIAEKNALLAKANNPRELKLKVGEKGGVSLYGLNARFPDTKYLEQWRRVIGDENDATDLGFVPQIKAFIRANIKSLKLKDGSFAKAA